METERIFRRRNPFVLRRLSVAFGETEFKTLAVDIRRGGRGRLSFMRLFGRFCLKTGV